MIALKRDCQMSRPEKLDTIEKLEARLNDPAQIEKHNGFNFSNLKAMIEHNVSTASAARAFGVQYATMAKWRTLFPVQ